METKHTTAATDKVVLKRDQNGYGALPSFEGFTIPDEGFAPGAVVNGNEIAIVELCDDESARETAEFWLGGGIDISPWMPRAPESDIWYLATVAESEEGPVAVFARPGQHGILTGKAYA